MRKKRILAALMGCVLLLSVLLVGCEKKEDTRQYIRTIGVVVTNDVNNVFEELYIYPNGEHEMGPDHIQSRRGVTRVGSYGATLEESELYDILVRDNRGGVYTFEAIELQNADEAVISYEEALLLTIHHRGGGTDEVEGQYVSPGDAPDHPQSRLQQRVSYGFTLQNTTETDIVYLTMREAADQDKGDVELYIDTITAGDTVSISGKLSEEDQEITEWVLYMEMANGEYYISETFDPWTTESITVSQDGEEIQYEFQEGASES
ncbi:hypothetical protein LJC49_08385 [Ruminococcaceae bacterium OttesenSCG-928-I18]|nr:hypothetical protein [Ruminococcaceae bacterium OttesenSCG-928-I18]